MTQSIELPLRAYQAPWPGLNTRGGLTMRAGGELEDCTNVQINEADILSKRRGIIRALDERFDGPVCGLFRYEDQFGQEWLLVADSTSIKIRQPFTIPTFTVTDAYPVDDFAEALSSDNWRNLTPYSVSGGSLIATLANPADAFAAGDFLRWFKDAASSSYFVQVQYGLGAGESGAIVIKGNGDLSSGARLQADVRVASDGSRSATLRHFLDSGQVITLGTVDSPATGATGFLTLRYFRSAVTGSLTAEVELDTAKVSGELNTVEDAALGQRSAIAVSSGGELLSVTGGAA